MTTVALSVGEPGQRPVLTLPDGKRLLLTIIRHVPYTGHEFQQSLDDDEDAANALPAGEDAELAVERGMPSDDDVVASSADSDVDFNTSAVARECRVLPWTMAKLPAGWSTPALQWTADVSDTRPP